ncbi:GNAT family N-acetyltransferase [Dysgonomonas sp. 521]|uniref:GNAT family N-acetyltransferase n=1 Tax=Dysgonomonas sp. 521 TaxID=2302932 RepID=UPI0013D5ABDA|nr:GNAT family N-acetyltransferase [Dysgonomonas sp. 521]NDV97222.1 GNAT family N-acetyltransferase [Dysgonomonas sp. 521]
MKPTINPIEEKDFKELVALFLEFATFEKLPEKMTNSEEKMKAEKDYFHGFIARDENNEVIGYVTFFFAYYTWVGKSLYMDDLYIREKYRGKGFGSLLINKVMDHARQTKCNRLRWQVSDWNEPAIAFYKNLGTKIDDTERNCDITF